MAAFTTGAAPGVEMLVPTISIFIGFPSSWTLLYLFTAATASCLREKTTSAVPYEKEFFFLNYSTTERIDQNDQIKPTEQDTFDLPLLS